MGLITPGGDPGRARRWILLKGAGQTGEWLAVKAQQGSLLSLNLDLSDKDTPPDLPLGPVGKRVSGGTAGGDWAPRKTRLSQRRGRAGGGWRPPEAPGDESNGFYVCFFSGFLKSSMKCPLQNKPPVKPHFLTLPATDGRGQAGCVGGKRCQGACRWSPHQSDRGPPGFRTLKRGTEKSHRQPVVGSYTLSTVHPEIPEHPLQRKGPPVSVADGLP